jgi:hypothetical protein
VKNEREANFEERRQLNIADQIAHFYFQGFGDFQQRGEGSFHIAALDFANEIMMQVRFLRQFLLRQTGLIAVGSDFVAHSATVIWLRRHGLSKKQEVRRASTQHNVFYTCLSFFI